MQVSTAGGPQPGPGDDSGDTEQTDSDGELDTAAQARPLGSKVSLPQTHSPPPTASCSLGVRCTENLGRCLSAAPGGPPRSLSVKQELSSARAHPGNPKRAVRAVGPAEGPAPTSSQGPGLGPEGRLGSQRAGWGPGRWPLHPSGKQTPQALSSASFFVSLQPTTSPVLTAVCFCFRLSFK